MSNPASQICYTVRPSILITSITCGGISGSELTSRFPIWFTNEFELSSSCFLSSSYSYILWSSYYYCYIYLCHSSSSALIHSYSIHYHSCSSLSFHSSSSHQIFSCSSLQSHSSSSFLFFSSSSSFFHCSSICFYFSSSYFCQ